MKCCPTCGETDLDKFGSNRSRKDGLTTYCLPCKGKKALESYYRHRDKRLGTIKEKRLQEPERFRQYARTHYRNHPENWKKSARLWRQRNPEKVRMQSKRYHAKPEYKAKRRVWEKAYRQTPQRKEYFRAYQRERYHKLREQNVPPAQAQPAQRGKQA